MPSASRINGSEPVYSSFRFGALGTQWEIATGEPLDAALRQLVLKRIDDFERTYSRFRDDSLVAHIAAAHEGGRFLFPTDSTVLFDLYDRLYEATGGAVARMGVRTDEGEEVVIGPNQVFDLPPGHVTLVEGDEELVMLDWAGGAGFDVRPGENARVWPPFSSPTWSAPRRKREKPATRPGNAPWPCTTMSSAPCWSASAAAKSRPRETHS
jgi:hypothetical protein